MPAVVPGAVESSGEQIQGMLLSEAWTKHADYTIGFIIEDYGLARQV